MQFVILLSNSIFASFLLLLYAVSKSDARSCDLKWIRMVYMLSCGKKKRESGPMRNESFSEPLPTDLYGAIHYFKERDPTNPLFNEDNTVLNEILNEDEKFEKERHKYSKTYKAWRKPKKFTSRESDSSKKVRKGQSRLGIRGFPDQWDVRELSEQRNNENYRRQIDRLLEQCCHSTDSSTCTGDTFRGAC